MKKNILILVISILFSIYLTELLLTGSKKIFSTDLNHLRQKEAIKKNISYDLRTSIDVLTDYKKNNVVAYPAIYPSSVDLSPLFSVEKHNFFPLSGISDILTVHCNETGYWVTYHSDEFGFNNNLGQHQYNKKSLHLIGDSFVHGNCVSRKDNIASLLSKNTEYSILNLGFGANDPLLELATLVEYTKPLKPNIVVWNYFEGNDLAGLKVRFNNQFLHKYLTKGFTQNLRNKQPVINTSLKTFLKNQQKYNAEKNTFISSWIIFLKLTKLRALIYKVTGKSGYKCPQEDVSRLFDILKRAKDEVESWGGTFYFSYFPAWERYAGNEKELSCSLKLHDEIISFAKTEQMNPIDSTEIFNNHTDALSLFNFRINGHYNKKGYKLIAKKLAQEIKKKEEK